MKRFLCFVFGHKKPQGLKPMFKFLQSQAVVRHGVSFECVRCGERVEVEFKK